MSAQFVIPATPPFAEVSETLGASQAVVLPTNARTVVTGGQVGFREDLSISPILAEQVEQIMINADKVLRSAGVEEGLKAVYQVTLYMLEMSDDFLVLWKEMKAKYMGGAKPVETGVTVPLLYGGAKVEMTFYAVAGSEGRVGKL